MIPISTDISSTTIINLAALPAKDRFPFWEGVIGEHFSPSRNSTPGSPADFTALMALRKIGPLALSRLGTSAMDSVRDRDTLRRKPHDCFFVSLPAEGRSFVRQGGRETRQGPGDFVMYDSASTFEISMPGDDRGSWIRLPRQLVTNRMVQAETLTARVLCSDDPVAGLVAGIIREAHGLKIRPDSPAAIRIALSIIDLPAAAFEAQVEGDRAGTPRFANLPDRAKFYIQANIEHPGLDCDRLAQVLGVSPRTLNRAFAREGSTPIRWVWQQRLRRAHEMLAAGTEPRNANVALKCGFGELSHFSRSFRAEFGVTPKALQARIH